MGYEYAVQTPFPACAYPWMPTNASAPEQCDQTFADIGIVEYHALRAIALVWTLALLAFVALELSGAIQLSVNQARWRGERSTFAAKLLRMITTSYKSMSKAVLIVLLVVNIVRVADIRGSGGAIPPVLSLILDELANAVTIVICSLYSLSISAAVGRTLRIGALSVGRRLASPVLHAMLLVAIPVGYTVLALCDGITGVGATFFVARSVLLGCYAMGMGVGLTLSTGPQWVRIVFPQRRVAATTPTTEPLTTVATVPVSPVGRAARSDSHALLLGGDDGLQRAASRERSGGGGSNSNPEMRVTATSGAFSSTSLVADTQLLSERTGGAGVSAGAAATAALESTGLMSTASTSGAGLDTGVGTSPTCTTAAPQLSEPGDALAPVGDAATSGLAAVTGTALEDSDGTGSAPESGAESEIYSAVFAERRGGTRPTVPSRPTREPVHLPASRTGRPGSAHSLPASDTFESSRSLARSPSAQSMTPDDSAILHRSANLRDGGVNGFLAGYLLVAAFNNLILVVVGVYALFFAATNATAQYSPTLTIGAVRPLLMYFQPAGVLITIFVLPPWFLCIVSSRPAAAYFPRRVYHALSGHVRVGRKRAWPGRRHQRVYPAMRIDVNSDVIPARPLRGGDASSALSPHVPRDAAATPAAGVSPRLPPVVAATLSPRLVLEPSPRSPASTRVRPPPLLETKAPTVNRNPTVRSGARPGGVGVVVSDALTTIAEAGPLEEEGAHEAEEVSGPEEEEGAATRAFDFAGVRADAP